MKVWAEIEAHGGKRLNWQSMKSDTVFLVSAVLLGVCGVTVLRAQTPGTPQSPASPGSTGSLVAGYKRWTRVNTKPHMISSNLASLCRSVTPEELATEAANPHIDTSDHPTLLRQKFVIVYVNKIAERAMLHQSKPVFPKGSLIVKEKLATPESNAPEMLTVMQKREKGYNAIAGDWEYLVLDGAGKQIQAHGRLENCQSCHAKWKETDYVSRAYLSADPKRRLK